MQGVLPHGLSFELNNVQVVQQLGEPHNKGGNNVPVWIEYQDRGLQINFKGLSFEVIPVHPKVCDWMYTCDGAPLPLKKCA